MQFRNQRSMSKGAAALLVAFVLVAAGCGSSASDASPATDSATPPTATGESTPNASAPTATDTVQDTSAPSSESAAVDSCTLLSDDEAAQFLGTPVTDVGPTSGVGESVCQYADDEGGSIVVSVGSSGTAPGNTFVPENLFGVEPKPVAELDGAGWDIGLGTVDFAAGERHNSVMVVSFESSDTNAQTATAVAVLIRDRIEAAP